jgi:hypothetical protein
MSAAAGVGTKSNASRRVFGVNADGVRNYNRIVVIGFPNTVVIESRESEF